MTGVSARLRLLDQQLVDRDGLRFGRVDDVELRPGPNAVPQVAAILVGVEALGRRRGGRLGSAMAATAARLRSREHPPGPPRIEPGLIEVGQGVVRVRAPLAELRGVAPLEDWLSRQVVSRFTRSRS